jgi:hypothetical protein
MASGESASEFAAREGCRPKALMVWRWQLGLGPRRGKKQLPAVVKQAAPRFVELLSPHVLSEVAKPPVVAANQSSRAFEITLPNGSRVVVPPQFDRQALGVLIELVGGR